MREVEETKQEVEAMSRAPRPPYHGDYHSWNRYADGAEAAIRQLHFALAAAEWGFNHARCAVCAGFDGESEGDYRHNEACPVGIALGRTLTPIKKSRDHLSKLIEQAVKKFQALPWEEQEKVLAAQRRSWVIGELMLLYPDMTREEAERRAIEAGA